MQSQNPFISDLVKLANSAAGTFAGIEREAKGNAKERFKEFLGGMDFVSREEFDAVKAMAAKAREENSALLSRIEALEAQISGRTAPKVRAKAEPKVKATGSAKPAGNAKTASSAKSAEPAKASGTAKSTGSAKVTGKAKPKKAAKSK